MESWQYLISLTSRTMYLLKIMFIYFFMQIIAKGCDGSGMQPWALLRPINESLNPSRNHQRIVGGTEMDVSAHPWMVGLYTAPSFRKEYFECGATLINENFVLSAAHCVYLQKPKNLFLLFGGHTIGDTFTEALQRRKAEKFIIHEYFDPKTLRNDLALIRVNQSIKLSKTVGPICLAMNSENLVGEIVRVVGWGRMHYGGVTPDEVQSAELKVISSQECQAYYSTTGLNLQPNVLCTLAVGKDSCSGDSGGPLLIKDKLGTFIQVGIIVGGISCAFYPGMNVEVAKYRQWIEHSAGALKSCDIFNTTFEI